MLGIKANGYFLDVKPDQQIELERKSPFFAIEEAFGEATPTPISFLYTENNCIALGWIYQYYSSRQKKKINVEVYDDGGFFCLATLIIQTGRMNLNRVEDSEVAGHLLFGASQFMQITEGKLLSDLKLGGVRNFNFTTNNPTDGSNGYWQHFHQTWTDNTIPYVFLPVRNAEYYGENSDVEWMNKLGDDAKLKYDFFSPLVPMIRLKYLLQCIFEEFKFTVDFSGLNDTQWERLLVVNLTRIDWVTTGYNASTNDIADMPKASIQIDLRKHVPPRKSITNFIVQLFNRYGWAPVFDIAKKKCTLVAGKELGKRARKDWTPFAEPLMEYDFSEDQKVFAFKNVIDPNDKFPVPGDFTNAKYGAPVLFKHSLPDPLSELNGRIIFVFFENRFYQVQLNEATNQYEWAIFSDNIFDHEPENATDTISTDISTLPCYLSQYRKVGGTDYFGVFPVMQQEFNSESSYRFIIYQGLCKETTASGTLGTLFYPHATNSRNDIDGPFVEWSDTYNHVIPTNNVNMGIRQYWWYWFLWLLQAGEEDVIKIWLPRHELINFKWDDEILIKNISYVVKSLIQPLPYDGYVVAKMKRFVKKVPVIIEGTGTNSNNTSNVVVVYARLTVYNTRPITSGAWICDVKINLYRDAAGTLPYNPPSTIYAVVKTWQQYSGSSVKRKELIDHHSVSNAEQIILKDVWHKSPGTPTLDHYYELRRNATNDYVVI